MDQELLQIVLEDLEYLSSHWDQDIDDASLRRTSPVLRTLLIDGKLLAAAKEVGLDIRVLTPAITKAHTETEMKSMKFYQAGGAKYQGNIVQSFSIINRALSPEERKDRYEIEKKLIGKNYPVKLSEFLRQASFVVEGIIINREEVIKYVANKLGGAHYDSNRRSSPPGAPISLEDKYMLLDSIRNSTMVADKNAIYYELLSIGQRLVNNHDIQLLQKKLRQALGTKSPK